MPPTRGRSAWPASCSSTRHSRRRGGIVSEFEATDGVVPFPGWEAFDAADVADLDERTRADAAARMSSVPAAVPTDPLLLVDDRRFAVPVTVLSGSLDEAGLREALSAWGAYADELARVHDTRVVTLGSGHWPQFSIPERLAAAVVTEADRSRG